MGIIDFSAIAAQKAAQPHYKVGLLSFNDTQQILELMGRRTLIANGTGINVPAGSKDIPSDEISFDSQAMEYFRYMLLSITERLAKDDPSAWQAPMSDSRHEGDYLRPIFSQVLKRGTTMLTVLREMQQTKFPVPEEFLVFLPSADSRNPSRDDVIRSLVPFKKAQREALQAAWQDETIALRITHGPAKPSIVLQ